MRLKKNGMFEGLGGGGGERGRGANALTYVLLVIMQ